MLWFRGTDCSDKCRELAFVFFIQLQGMLTVCSAVLLLPFQAFRSIKCFLSKLEKVSENPELALEAGKLKWEGVNRWFAVLCVFWVAWFIFMFIYVLFYLGQLSHFPSCFGAGITNLNEPPSRFLLPPHYCGLGAGSIPFRAIVNNKQCEMRRLLMSLVIDYWIGDIQDSQGLICLRNDRYCVGWGVKPYSLTDISCWARVELNYMNFSRGMFRDHIEEMWRILWCHSASFTK